MARKRRLKSQENIPEPAKESEKSGMKYWSLLRTARRSLEYTEKPLWNETARERKAHILLLVAITTVCLFPFVGKAFNIDDPLFIWAAKNIQMSPLDPYGFNVNWYGIEMPMSNVNKNPPIVSYYMAIVGFFFGLNEVTLHIAFLLPAIAVIIGTFLIACHFCARPILASLVALLTPVFLVSSTTVMSDTMMLAFWVFAVYFWVLGLGKNSFPMLLLSVILIPLSALTKYFGLTLIPLLLFYSVFKRRNVGRWVLFMLLPVAILAWYQWATHELYGHGLLMDAASYAAKIPSQFGKLSLAKILVGLSFTGGCILVVLFFTKLLWSWKEVSIGVILTFIITIVVASAKSLGNYQLPEEALARWIIAFQLGLFTIGGISLLAIAILDFARRRDADSSLLFLWIVGTFIFATFINWTTSARNILPMIPAAGILIERRIEQQRGLQKPISLRQLLIPLMGAALVGLALTWSDYRLAESVRTASTEIRDKYLNKRENIWFSGHWGFQYYMQNLGAKPFDIYRSTPTSGDIFIIPNNNTNPINPRSEYVRLREIIKVPSGVWLTTMNHEIGAGFYSDVWGPLPFAVGTVPLEQYSIFEVNME
jgi:4-amino-4-deoxy-L-arabinose transferase-like glycosyltransferase